MTNTLTLRSLDIPNLHKLTVGFDSLFDRLQRMSNTQTSSGNYPPYNLIKHTDDKYTIELAVAGFKQGDIEVQIEKDTLIVKGEQAVDLDEGTEYLHHGISARSFLRTWPLSEHVEVLSASMQDGILSIQLERQIPEEAKPKSIEINYIK